jgi:hypothetical protein
MCLAPRARATLMGLGVRVAWAATTEVSVDTELTGIRSSDASFRDVSFEGTTGDILRNMKGARFVFTGTLRKGGTYQPFVRLGAGLQVIDHDVRLVTGATTTTGPGDGLALDGLVTLGSGFDIKLGEHWTAGAGFSFFGGFSGTKTAAFSTAIEGGIHVGYGWGGYKRY